MINVDNVTKQFGDFYALKDCTIKIGSGSAYGLLGSNGAGNQHCCVSLQEYTDRTAER